MSAGATLRNAVRRLTSQRPTLFARCLLLITCCLLTNVVLWAATLITAPPSGSNGKFASLALIAWTTGLRHALDADHICAITAGTRRLCSSPERPRHGRVDKSTMTIRERLFFWKRRSKDGNADADDKGKAEGADDSAAYPVRYQRPTTVGLFFSLGHSTIVVAVTLAVAISISVAGKLSGVGDVGGIIGQSVSGSFLFLVAVINSVILAKTIRAQRRAKQSSDDGDVEGNANHDRKQHDSDADDAVDDDAAKSDRASSSPHFTGFVTRLVSPLLKAVTRPWHMYFVGVAFGIGFDTASTIALLSVAAAAGRGSADDVSESDASRFQGGNAKVILLAFLFTAGMTLVDSLDSVMMINAYCPQSGRWWALFERREEREGGNISIVGSETNKQVDGRDEFRQDQQPSQQQGHPQHSAQSPEDVEKEAQPAIPPHHATPPTPHLPPTLSATATHLSLLLTLLSIIMAFAISVIVIMSLLAGNCGACSRSLELHNEPITDDAGNAINDGGLAGRWWNFWDQAGEQSGYIGAGIAGFFLVFVLAWWGGRVVIRKRNARVRERARRGEKSGVQDP